jgi:hypothetical protein
MRTVNELLKDAVNLSEGDRLSLASQLLAYRTPADTRQVEAAWDVEIRERIKRYETGEAKLHQASDVFRDVDKLLAS